MIFYGWYSPRCDYENDDDDTVTRSYANVAENKLPNDDTAAAAASVFSTLEMDVDCYIYTATHPVESSAMDDDILKGDQQRMVLRAEADYYSPVIHVNDDDIHPRRTVTAATDNNISQIFLAKCL